MDPHKALRDAREEIIAYQRMESENWDNYTLDDYLQIPDNLVTAVDAIDSWMSKGGFSPWEVK